MQIFLRIYTSSATIPDSNNKVDVNGAWNSKGHNLFSISITAKNPKKNEKTNKIELRSCTDQARKSLGQNLERSGGEKAGLLYVVKTMRNFRSSPRADFGWFLVWVFFHFRLKSEDNFTSSRPGQYLDPFTDRFHRVQDGYTERSKICKTCPNCFWHSVSFSCCYCPASGFTKQFLGLTYMFH
jgi:hypothetical protein